MDDVICQQIRRNLAHFLPQYCKLCNYVHKDQCNYLPYILQQPNDYTCTNLSLVMYYPQTNYSDTLPLSQCVELHKSFSYSVILAGSIYIMGAYDCLSSNMYFFQISQTTPISLIRKKLMPFPLNGPALAYYNRHIYLIGGHSFTFKSACMKYSTVNDQWVSLPDLQIPRYYNTAIATKKGIIYTAGGINVTDSIIRKIDFLDSIECLLYGADHWTLLSPIKRKPVKRKGLFMICVSENELILAGGSRTSGETDRAEKISISGDKYSVDTSTKLLVHAEFRQSSVMKWNKAYCIDYRYRIHCFDIESSKWTVYS